MFNKPINRWWTVLAGCLGNGVGAGIIAAYALGVFTKAISADFGWDRSYTTLGITCFFFTSGIGSLLLGSLLAKWSIRGVTILFVSLYSISVMLVGVLPPSVILFCVIYSFMGLFGSAATAVPYAIVISRQFDSNRGLALALMISGAGIGALVLPNFANLLLENYGWRVGYFGIGLVAGVVAISSLVFFLRTPQVEQSAAKERELGLKEIFFSKGPFWLIALSILAISITLVGLVTNMVPILTDRGISNMEAASIVGLTGGASWVSRLFVGVLVDRFHAKIVAAGIFLFATVGVAILALSPMGIAGTYVAVLLLGLGVGAEADLITFMVSRYFSFESLSRALGAVWIFWAWGNGIGVFVASLAFDLTGTYDLAFLIFGALGLLSFVLILRLGPYHFPIHGSARTPHVSSQRIEAKAS